MALAELTLRQIEEVAKDAPVELGVLLIGAQELMVTEHCMLMSQGPCDENCAECPRRKSPHVLKDRKGYEFPVVTDAMGQAATSTTRWNWISPRRCPSCSRLVSPPIWWTPPS